MLSTIDGKTDGSSLKEIIEGTEYEETGAALDGDAWICGRVTMQEHFAEESQSVAESGHAVGEPGVHVARKAESYAIAVDTRGTLNWSSGDLDGEHLITVLSELATTEYLDQLRAKNISYIVTGKQQVDLASAVTQLRTHFGIATLLLEGGGHINGAFLAAQLVDEVSIVLAPAIDGRRKIASVFDGLGDERSEAFPLQLKSVQQLEGGVLWLRYTVDHSKMASTEEKTQ